MVITDNFKAVTVKKCNETRSRDLRNNFLVLKHREGYGNPSLEFERALY